MSGGADTSTTPGARAVVARIVYWGPQGSGKAANLRAAHGGLRPDHRGALQERATRVDPEARVWVLPIELGRVAGVDTRIQVCAAPGAPERALARKQLLDRADGIVFVADSRRSRRAANVASFEELRAALLAGGRELADVPLVIQYNRRDAADAFEIEELHAKLGTVGAAVFEAVASDGRGVLETLSTISKRVVKVLRDGPARIDLSAALEPAADLPSPPAQPAPAREPAPPQPSAKDPIPQVQPDPDASATVARAHSLFDQSWAEITSGLDVDVDASLEADGFDVMWARSGEASVAPDGAVRVPVALQDDQGRTLRLTVSLRIEPGDGPEQD